MYALLLLAAATSGQAESNAWIRCLFSASDRLDAPDERADVVADASFEACNLSENQMWKWYFDLYTRTNHGDAIEKATADMTASRKRLRTTIIRQILERRACARGRPCQL